MAAGGSILGPDLFLQSLGPSDTETYPGELSSSGVPARAPDQWPRIASGQGQSPPALPCEGLWTRAIWHSPKRRKDLAEMAAPGPSISTSHSRPSSRAPLAT